MPAVRPRSARSKVPEARLDRQLRIRGWNQRALAKARLAIVGDEDLLASLYVLSAAALGLRHLLVIAPRLDPRLRRIAERLEPGLALRFLEGFLPHPVLGDLLDGCDAIVDLSRYGLANKLLLETGYRNRTPVIRAFCYEQEEEQGVKGFTYLRGREWEELREIVSGSNLPRPHFDDGVLDIIAAGIALEETKNVLMGRRTSEELISYRRPVLEENGSIPGVCVVGAGALGNFVGFGLACAGCANVAFLDPDTVDVTNLNRQVFLAGSVGSNKAEALAAELNRLFGTEYRGQGASFGEDTDLAEYEVVFDCTDNFETKVAISERCRESSRILISGGTGVESGQAIVYVPGRSAETPADTLGLHGIVRDRGIAADRRKETSCVRAPDPSVIMTNQIVAGLMVDSMRMVLAGRDAPNLFYDSGSDRKF